MITDQELALANIRFLAKADERPEFYDMLRARLSIQEEAWASQQLTADELILLDAKKRRILWDLDYLQSIATLSAMASATKPNPEPAAVETPVEPERQLGSGSIEPASVPP
jgi:hypothetical protein